MTLMILSNCKDRFLAKQNLASQSRLVHVGPSPCGGRDMVKRRCQRPLEALEMFAEKEKRAGKVQWTKAKQHAHLELTWD